MVIPRRFVEATPQGQSGPAFFECDDGNEYLLKFHGPNMNRLLFNEFVSYKLANILGLPIPPATVAEIQPVLRASTTYLNGKTDMYAFASRRIKWIDNVNPDGTYKMYWWQFVQQASNLNMVPDILVFDMWIRNFDRAGLGRNYGNLVLGSGLELFIIDHGHALGGVNNSPQRDAVLVNPIGNTFFASGPLTQALAFHVTVQNGVNPFNRIVDGINSIPIVDIQQIVQEASSYWPLAGNEGTLICNFLEQRRQNLRPFISYLVDGMEFFMNYGGEQLRWI